MNQKNISLSQQTLSKSPQRLACLPAVLFPCGVFALFFAQSQGPLVGLMQRLLVSVISGWLILVAAKIRWIATAKNRTFSRGLSSNPNL